jgi:2-aminoadipate transaminase
MTDRHTSLPAAFDLSAEALRMRPNAIRALTAVIARPDVISFAGGVPSPATFPAAELADIAARLIREQGDRVLQYASTRGNARLAAAVAGRMRDRGVAWASADGVILTSGSQQGLDLVARVLVDPGDVVFVELPSYIGGLAALWAAGAELKGFRLGGGGPDLDELEARVAAARRAGRRPRAVYTIPTFQNPSGITADAASRAGMLELARRHDLVVIEDDPYGEVYFRADARPPAPVAALEGASERVVYLGSFSKVLCPGLRTAWVAANPALCGRLELAKEAADLCSSTLDQAIVAEAIDAGLVDGRLPAIREFYGVRCSAMLDALERAAPEGAAWTRPTGGLFVWLTLPEGVDAAARLEAAVAAGVAYVPGGAFFVDGSGANTARLAFSKEDPERIAQGVATLLRTVTGG